MMRMMPKRKADGERGFTLVELMIVMAVIGILLTIAIPAYLQAIKKAKEAVLKEDLHTMRTAIDQYTVDKEKAPQGLEDLVQAGYLTSESDTLTDINETQGGIDDVKSGSQGLSLDGTSYNSW
jgi:general secretion pathway protein G